MVYRAHDPKWAFDPASGDGAALHGGRFNRPRRAALYTSLDQQGAWTEAQQGFPFKAQPVTIRDRLSITGRHGAHGSLTPSTFSGQDQYRCPDHAWPPQATDAILFVHDRVRER